MLRGLITAAYSDYLRRRSAETEAAFDRATEEAVRDQVAAGIGAPVVDINGWLGSVAANPVDFLGVQISPRFLSGLVSADGVHPSNLSHALIADQTIATLNAAYGMSIPRVHLFELLTVFFMDPHIDKDGDKRARGRFLFGLLETLGPFLGFTGDLNDFYANPTATGLDGDSECDVLAIDNLDAIAGDSAWETYFYRIINRCRNGELRFLFAMSVRPDDLQTRLDDFRSRLQWGLMLQLPVSNDAEVREILRYRARLLGIGLSDEVISYLMTHYARDLSAQMSILRRLDETSLLHQRKITIPLIKTALQDPPA